LVLVAGTFSSVSMLVAAATELISSLLDVPPARTRTKA
jgi:hypothetical protein